MSGMTGRNSDYFFRFGVRDMEFKKKVLVTENGEERT